MIHVLTVFWYLYILSSDNLFIYLFLSPTVNTKLKTFPCLYVTAVKAFCNSGVSLKFFAGQHLVYMEDKVCIWANVANQAGGYPGFCSIK